MIGMQQLDRLAHATVYDPAGEKVGNVKQVFIDEDTGGPGWVSVHTGLFGMSESFVPVHDAELKGDRVTVSVDRQRVKDAPRIDPHHDPSGRDVIDEGQMAELYRYYNLTYRRSGRHSGDLQGRRPTGGAPQTQRRPAEGAGMVTDPTRTAGTKKSTLPGAGRPGAAGPTAVPGAGKPTAVPEARTGTEPTGTRRGAPLFDPESGPASRTSESRTGAEPLAGTKPTAGAKPATDPLAGTKPTAGAKPAVDPLAGTGQRGATGKDTAAGGEEQLETTRYEERLRVATEPFTIGRVRLRKYVVTENVTTTVPVRHEEVRLERVPVTEGQPAAEHQFSDETVETVLRGERPVVTTEAVPVETIRLAKHSRTEQQEVGGQVRKELVDVEDETKPAKRDTER